MIEENSAIKVVVNENSGH